MLEAIMTVEDPRLVLDALIQSRGEDYASLSRLLGRNAAYIQQYIKRGVPRKLDEEDRRTLARYFAVPEERLAGTVPVERPAFVTAAAARTAPTDMVLVPRLDIGASAGPGAFSGEERTQDHIAFQSAWLRDVADGPPAGLSIIRVVGDSMAPTLINGDDILVDRGDGADRLRDGIYVLRVDDALLVKRLALLPAGKRFSIRSDNPHYPPWEDCDPASITIVGRVVWTGRRLS